MQKASTDRLGRRFLIVSSGILLSKSLGLARDMVFASVWGTGTALAAFVVAFTIPNLLRGLFGEGAFNSAFIPLFTEKLEHDSRERAWQLAYRILSLVGVVLAILTVVTLLFSLLMREMVADGLPRLTFSLLFWLMPYSILICLAAGLAAILNSIDRFAIPAYSQLLLNVSMILAALVISPLISSSPETRMYVVVGAILAAGVFQLIIHIAAVARERWRFRFEPTLHDADVLRFSVLLAPILLGTGVVQVNVVVDRLLAAYLGSTATTTLYYSQRLVYLPVGLFGVALSIVALPTMSKAWARGDRAAFLANLSLALRLVLFLTIPTVAMLYALRVPAIRLLFERGEFGAAATRETAWTLLFYLCGIPAFACAKIATAPFHARQDTRTPVKIAAACLVLNIVLNLILMQFIRQGGLALSTSICSYLNILLLFVCLRKQIGELRLGIILPSLFKISVAAVVAAAVAAAVLDSLSTRGVPDLSAKLFQVAVPLGTGGVAFVVVAAALRTRELGILVNGMLAVIGKRK